MSGRRVAAALILCLVLCPTALLVSGCWDRREFDDWAYVGMVSFDVGSQPGWLRVSILVQQPGSSISTPSPAARTPTSFVQAVSEGPTFFAADQRLEELTNRFLTYAHVQIIVVGEELAKRGLEALVDPLSRSRAFHRSILMAVADGTTGEEVLASLRGDIEPFPATYAAHLIDKVHGQYGESRYSRIHDFLVAWASKGKEIVLPLIKLAEKPPSAKPPGQSGGGDASGGQPGGAQASAGGAGGAQASGGASGAGASGQEPQAPVERRAEANGLALFRGPKLVAKTTGEQAMGINLVCAHFMRGRIVVNGVATGGTDLSIELSHYERKVTLKREGESATIEVKVRLKGLVEDVSAAGADISSAGLERVKGLVASKLAGLMSDGVRLAQSQVGGDIFDFQLHARGTFSTWWEWMAFDWGKTFREAKVTVEATVTEIRAGLAGQTPESQD